MPWTTLIFGCLAGTVVLAVVAHSADTSHWQLSQAGVRYAFLPAIAALAFVPRAAFRPLTQATPGPGLGEPGRPHPAGRARPGPDRLDSAAHHGAHRPGRRQAAACRPSIP